jgi:hypothetical protein
MRMLRFEYKYIIPNARLERLRGMISMFMAPDPFAAAGGGEYTVRSIYFDAPDLRCYYDKLEGVKRRHKVRLRGYNESDEDGDVFFEIKKKVGEPLYKNRAQTTYGEAQKLLTGEAMESNPADNARRFMYHLHAWRMQPVTTVIYEREPYETIFPDEANDLRITFDKNLRAQPYPALDELFLEDRAKYIHPGFFIMEIKFNRYLPSWVKGVVNGFGLRKGPASKYALSMEALGLTKTRRSNVR